MQGLSSVVEFAHVQSHQSPVVTVIQAVFLAAFTVVIPALLSFCLVRSSHIALDCPRNLVCLAGLAVCILGAAGVRPVRQSLLLVMTRIFLSGMALGVVVALL